VSEGKTKEQAVEVFKKIAANSAITSGHTTTTELVVAGQYSIAANNYIHRALELQGKGAPLAFTPVQIPVVAEITALALPCLSANPAGALLLQDFMLSADGGQKAFIEDGRSPSNAALAQDTFGGQAITPIEVDVAGISANYEAWATLWDEVIRNGSKK
jgi:iron(III) transport system substrate-binding protein